MDLKTSKHSERKYLELNTYKKDDTTAKETSDESVMEFEELEEVPF